MIFSINRLEPIGVMRALVFRDVGLFIFFYGGLVQVFFCFEIWGVNYFQENLDNLFLLRVWVMIFSFVILDN